MCTVTITTCMDKTFHFPNYTQFLITEMFHFSAFFQGGSPVGQLTKVGQQQMYELGKKCGKLYIDDLKFVQETCNPQEML